MSAILHRNAGMTSAAEGSPYFAAAAYAAIVAIAKRQATVHVDDVLTECSARPHHHNAWGGVYMAAIRAGIIARSGELRHCRMDRGKHAHAYPVYHSCVFVEPAAAVE